MKQSFIVLMICMLLGSIRPVLLHSEQITLKDGSSIEGTIVSEDTQTITVQFEAGIMAFDRNDVASVGPSLHIEPTMEDENTFPETTPTREESKPLTIARSSREVADDLEVQTFISYFGNKQAFEDAFKTFKEKARKEPNDYNNQYRLGLAYYYTKEYEPAITALNLVLKDNPKDLEAQRFLGHAYYKNARPDLAIPFLQSFITNRSGDINTRKFLANCYYEMSDYEHAILEYENILSKTPSDIHSLGRLESLYKKTNRTFKAKQLKEKQEQYRQIGKLEKAVLPN